VKRACIVIIGLATLLQAQNLHYRQDPNWQVPADAAAKKNPLADKPDLAAGGGKLFLRICAHCHGSSGTGLKNAADLLLPEVQAQSDGALFWKISNGNPDRGMPPWTRLPEPQRWQIVLYLRTLKAPPDPAQPNLKSAR
jgi:mono/diheme cytochrome c family protein